MVGEKLESCCPYLKAGPFHGIAARQLLDQGLVCRPSLSASPLVTTEASTSKVRDCRAGDLVGLMD